MRGTENNNVVVKDREQTTIKNDVCECGGKFKTFKLESYNKFGSRKRNIRVCTHCKSIKQQSRLAEKFTLADLLESQQAIGLMSSLVLTVVLPQQNP